MYSCRMASCKATLAVEITTGCHSARGRWLCQSRQATR